MSPRGLTKTSRRVWTLIRILALLFAIGLARQFATNVLSLHDILSDDQKAPSAPLRRGAVSSRSEQAPSVPPVPVLGELETDDPETNSVDEEEEEEALRPRREEVKVEDDVSPVLFVDEEEILPVSTPPPPPARPPPPKRSLPDLLRVMESQRSFSKSEFGYPADLIVVTQENAERLRAKLTRPERFLPELSPFALGVEGGGARHKSCALVGNAGIGRAANFGASIDRHDAVLRINQGPSKGYEKIVGSKTTYRLLNKKWASMYTSAQEGRRVFLPSEAANATILASRISGRTFEHLASVVRHARRDIRLLYVAQGLESRARNLLKGESWVEIASPCSSRQKRDDADLSAGPKSPRLALHSLPRRLGQGAPALAV